MVELYVEYSDSFKKQFKKIKDVNFKNRVRNQISKIVHNPYIGKPMRYLRKGTREVYVGSFRLAYIFDKGKLTLLFVEIYHKDEQ